MSRILAIFLVTIVISAHAKAQAPGCTAGSFCVGAAKREITAPPGYPTGGHGPAGGIARGSWNRNWSRAFVFKDGSGAMAVLVSCDTFAIPLSLTKHVWDAIKDKPELKGLKPEGLLISATHTHQGAANYMDAPAYNAFGSARAGPYSTFSQTKSPTP